MLSLFDLANKFSPPLSQTLAKESETLSGEDSTGSPQLPLTFPLLIYASAPLGGANAYMFYSLFFCRRCPSATTKCINMRKPFSGTAERIFMKHLPNDRGENVLFNVVPKWGLGPQNNSGGYKLKYRE